LPQLKDFLEINRMSSVELTGFYLDRIKKYDVELLAYLRITEDYALDAARDAIRSRTQ